MCCEDRLCEISSGLLQGVVGAALLSSMADAFSYPGPTGVSALSSHNTVHGVCCRERTCEPGLTSSRESSLLKTKLFAGPGRRRAAQQPGFQRAGRPARRRAGGRAAAPPRARAPRRLARAHLAPARTRVRPPAAGPDGWWEFSQHRRNQRVSSVGSLGARREQISRVSAQIADSARRCLAVAARASYRDLHSRCSYALCASSRVLPEALRHGCVRSARGAGDAAFRAEQWAGTLLTALARLLLVDAQAAIAAASSAATTASPTRTAASRAPGGAHASMFRVSQAQE